MIDSKGPTVVFIRGIPGSGKSFIANALSIRVSGSKVVLDPDEIDKNSQEYLDLVENLTNEGVDSKFYPYRFLRAKAHDMIEQRGTIIWNQAFTDLVGLQKTIINLTNHAEEKGLKLKFLVVEVEVDPALAKERISERAKSGAHDVDDENFERFLRDFRSFENEGLNVIKVDGSQPAEKSAEKILAQI